MTAKHWGNRFNQSHPPKQVDFIQCFVLVGPDGYCPHVIQSVLNHCVLRRMASCDSASNTRQALDIGAAGPARVAGVLL
jgi:hypothetical protein